MWHCKDGMAFSIQEGLGQSSAGILDQGFLTAVLTMASHMHLQGLLTIKLDPCQRHWHDQSQFHSKILAIDQGARSCPGPEPEAMCVVREIGQDPALLPH